MARSVRSFLRFTHALRGEIRVAADGPAPEDIQLELRLDRTAGESLRVTAQPISFPTTEVRLTNQIE
ncbi:hypothetical protein, partial [Rhodococcus koreensis]